jgi:hypothetical protein
VAPGFAQPEVRKLRGRGGVTIRVGYSPRSLLLPDSWGNERLADRRHDRARVDALPVDA